MSNSQQKISGGNAFVTTLLAGSAAIMACGAASAADLPSRKSGPVQYVKICDAYGAGFFTLPGSDTCVKIGGSVRFEMQYTPGQRVVNVATGATTQVAASQDTTGTEARASINLDARTPTEFGTARTFLRIRSLNNSGIRRTSGASNFQTLYPATSGSTTGITLERAYVEWAGFTFGNWGSEYAGLWPSGTVVGGSADFTSGWTNGVKGIAYKKSFGGGWTGVIQLDDRMDTGPQNAPGAANTAVLLAPTQANSTNTHRPSTGFNLVGVVRNEGAWGAVELDGMLGNNSTTDGPTPFANGGAANPVLGNRTYTSWALNSTLKINLPMIAAGDAFYVNVGYGRGAIGYVGAPDSWSTLVTDSTNRRILGGVIVAPSNLQLTSITAGGAPLAYGQTTAFQMTALFTHYWAPQWRTHVTFAYMNLGTPTALNPVGGLNTQLGNTSIWATKANLIYSPTKDFDVGVEAGYGQINTTIQNPTAAFVAAGSPGLKEGNWTTKLRVQRGF